MDENSFCCCSRACSEEGEAQLRRAFFSATLATEVEEWCSLNLDNVASVTIGQRHTATDTIKQTLVYTGKALFSIKISVKIFKLADRERTELLKTEITGRFFLLHL